MSRLLLEKVLVNGRVIQVAQGNITEEETEAIVNAANSGLVHGGGVAAAIVRAGGPRIQEESFNWVKALGPVPVGGVAITSGGSLKARYVIHAVGPVWKDWPGVADRLLDSCVRYALILANIHNCSSVAIPGISSGIFGGPKDVCARTAINAAHSYLINAEPENTVSVIRFVNIDDETAQAFEKAMLDFYK